MKKKYYWDKRSGKNGLMNYPELSLDYIYGTKQEIYDRLKKKLH